MNDQAATTQFFASLGGMSMRICSHCHRCYDDQIEFCTQHSHQALSETRSGSCEMISGYRLELLLESGIKGEVYRARQVECGQSCRIRLISRSKKSGHQFLKEAKHAASLFHPNLVDVYEAGALAGGEFYVVSEEPEGQTLREYLKTVGVPPLLSTIDLIEQTAEAVHVLHQEGLLHRALRPDNIVLTSDNAGRVVVRIKDIDLGGVNERSIISNKFLIDTALDAVRYFAPEQCTGGRASVQTDVYALGIILYEMLAGTPPFDAPKASGLIEKHRHQQPREIRIDNFDLRMLLTHTLSESLQKEPAKRHSSALAFARQLRHMEQLATHVSTPPPAIVVPPRQAGPGLATGAATAAAPARTPVVESVPEPALPVFQNAEPVQEEFVPEIVHDEYDPWTESDVYAAVEYETETLVDPGPVYTDLITAEAPTEVPQTDLHARKARLDRVSRLARMRLRNNRSKQIVPQETDEDAAEPSETQVEIARTNEIPSEIVPAETVEPPAPNFIEPEPDEITAVTARSKPKFIDWQQPEDDIPSIDDVIEALSEENKEPSFGIEAPAELDPTPTSRHKERSTKERDEIQFFPSVMRRSDNDNSLDIYPNYSILSGYGATQARFSFDYQTLMLGIGLIAIVLLFFVGNSMFRQYVQTETPAAPQSIESVFSQPADPQIAQTNPNKKTQKAFQKPRSDDGSGENGPSSNAPDAKSQPTSNAPSQNQASKNAVSGRNIDKSSSVSSTLVISTENGKVKSTIETARRSGEKKLPIAANRVTGTTRPRIVKNPNP